MSKQLRFTPEFQAEAVKLVLSSNFSASGIATTARDEHAAKTLRSFFNHREGRVC